VSFETRKKATGSRQDYKGFIRIFTFFLVAERPVKLDESRKIL